MEKSEIQKMIEVKRQAISTENNRLLNLNNKMAVLANKIELYEFESQAKLLEMKERYKQMQRSFESGNAYIDSCEKFIAENS